VIAAGNEREAQPMTAAEISMTARHTRSRLRLFALVVAACLLAPAAIAASAQAASPAWKVVGVPGPTHLPPADSGGDGAGNLAIWVTNVGGIKSSGVTTLTIGPLPEGITTSGTPTGGDFFTGAWSCTPTGAGQTTISCDFSGPFFNPGVVAGTAAPTVTVPLTIGPAAAAHSTIPLEVEGGGADSPVDGSNQFEIPVTVSSEPASPGITAMWAGAFDEDGKPATQAGSHPAHAGTFFLLNTIETPVGNIVPAGNLRDLDVDLPPGFVGNPLVTARCPLEENCSNDSDYWLGLAAPIAQLWNNPIQGSAVAGAGPAFPVFNAQPKPGNPAEFAFTYLIPTLHLGGNLRSDEDNGVTVSATNTPLQFQVFGAFTMLDGSPAAAAGQAFLTLGANCAGEAAQTPSTKLTMNTWQDRSVYDSMAVDNAPVTDCAGLTFEPSFSLQPDTGRSDSPAAITADLTVPDDGLTDPAKRATPPLKKAVVTLPEGVAVNPSSADGLDACTTAQIGLKGTGFPEPNPIRFTKDDPSCPQGSKIGTAEVQSPLLEDPVKGAVYLAAQGDNPFGTLVALYLVVDDDQQGIHVKLPGRVDLDPGSGRIVTTFDSQPQLPVSRVKLQFKSGDRAALTTPTTCGTYETEAVMTPWSAPESGPPAVSTSSFKIDQGPDGGPCAANEAARPFQVGFAAGSATPLAGAYSPFHIRITRADGNQELDRLALSPPPGLLASLRGVPYCPEAQIAAASSRTGRDEQAAPSCPAASHIGSTQAGAGAGPTPFYSPGSLYLAGPYKGAPLSVVAITPAVAGPFDLGTVVIRSALQIDPDTARITAITDPLPRMLKGVPLRIRDVRISLDRGNWIQNPTSCEAMAVALTAYGSNGAVAAPSNRFQVGGCDQLGFAPKLKLRLKGPTHRNAHPKLIANLKARPGDANIARTQVKLPRAAFIDNAHIGTVCTRVQFAADQCPAKSIYGRASATTPLLDSPISGPVYLRSSNNPLPDLVIKLRGPAGQPIEVHLAGKIDAVKGALRNTFEAVPDAPVSSFRLEMFGGKKGLIVLSSGLCANRRAAIRMRGQNGALLNRRPKIQAKCRASRKAGQSKHHRR
jgi:hypothetical protein